MPDSVSWLTTPAGIVLGWLAPWAPEIKSSQNTLTFGMLSELGLSLRLP